MVYNKQYPIKIFEDLYILDIANVSEIEKQIFLKLPDTDIMDFLIFQRPSVCFNKDKDNKRVYTPSFGKCIISPFETEPLRFKDECSAKNKSEEFFKKFERQYTEMVLYGCKLENVIRLSTPFE